jgi:hypothetical protein
MAGKKRGYGHKSSFPLIAEEIGDEKKRQEEETRSQTPTHQAARPGF